MMRSFVFDCAKHGAQFQARQRGGVGLVEVLREEFAAALQRGPVAVLADDRAKLGHADLEVAPEVHLAGLDDGREHRRRDPQCLHLSAA